MRKLILISLAVILTFLIQDMCIASQWYVSNSGNNTNSGTSWANSWHDVQYAINTASDYDQIYVAAGTYHERILVNKKIMLLGAQNGIDPTPIGARTNPANESIIDLVGLGVTNPNILIDIPVGTYDVYIYGFTLNGSDIFHYADEDVIRCSDNNVSLNCNIINGYYGVHHNGANKSFLVVNVNRITVNKVGITLQSTGMDHAWFGNNRIILGGSPASDAQGIYMTTTTNSTVTGNTAIGFAGGSLNGSGNSHLDIIGNTFTNCNKGVNLWGNTTFINVTNNTISNSTQSAINIKGADITISGNFLFNNGDDGIKMETNTITTQRIIVSSNSIYGNTNLAIYADPSVADIINASCNWFGSNDPTTVASKVTVSKVDYTPWLNSGTDITPGSIGFQGDFSNLWVSAGSLQVGSNGRIQEGINLVTSGGTVNVVAGTYADGFSINKSIILNGQDRTTTFLTGGQINITSPNVTLQGLDVKTSYTATYGIYAQANNITIQNCIIENNKTGIYCNTGGPTLSGLQVLNNIVRNNGSATDGAGGIYLAGSGAFGMYTSLVISGNQVTNNYAQGIGVESSTGAVISNNTVSGTMIPTGGGWAGNGFAIGVNCSLSGTISGNTISNGQRSGIVLWESQNCIVQNNSISGFIYNQGAGVYSGSSGWLHSATGNQIINNILSGNKNGVLQEGPASGLIVLNNSITGSTLYGVNNLVSNSITAINNWWGSSTGPTYSGNPGGTGDAITANVTYDPWIGQAQTNHITNADLNIPILFPSANTTMTFTSLPPGTNANVSVQRLSSPPVGVPNPPASAGSVCPVYLDITATGLTNYTFNVTIVLDVSTISGFSSTTEVMFYSTVTNSWVGANGTYDAINHTYTFTTNHFTPFGFVNPLNPDGLSIATDKFNPTATEKWYPQVGMGTGTIYGANDWTYENAHATFYVVPTGATGIFASKFTINWDPTKAGLTVTAGDYFGNAGMFFVNYTPGTGQCEVNWASSNLLNVTPGGGKYLAKLEFTNIKPGYIPVAITGTDFRYYENNATNGVFITSDPAAMLFYLGDFASTLPIQNTGDGKIEGNDLTVLSTAYWSTNGGVNYMRKFDIGPTTNSGTYWDLPNPDNQIEFEDLVIFAIGYGKYANGQLPQNVNQQPLVFSASAFIAGENGIIKLPVKVSGNVNDLRAYSMTLNYSNNLEYVGVEKQGEMTTGTTFLLGRDNGGKVQIDGAIIGGEGINHTGVIANVMFRLKSGQTQSAAFETIKARNSSNNVILVSMENGAEVGLPTSFGLTQNYPNPFNPSTLIKYQVPKTVKVTINIYDILGKLVAKLVDGEQQAGYYSIEWKATNFASGIYFYKMTAGDYSSVKKMIFVK